MYIRQTDETADLTASSYFTDTSCFDGIFDRGDRIGLLEQYADEYVDTIPKLAGLAQKLFESINSFFENAKDSYFKMPETYEHGVNCETLLGYLMGWSQKL